jgi:hypothetical protein
MPPTQPALPTREAALSLAEKLNDFERECLLRDAKNAREELKDEHPRIQLSETDMIEVIAALHAWLYGVQGCRSTKMHVGEMAARAK